METPSQVKLALTQCLAVYENVAENEVVAVPWVGDKINVVAAAAGEAISIHAQASALQAARRNDRFAAVADLPRR